MQYDTDTTTSQGKTTNLKNKSSQLSLNKYFLYAHFFTKNSPNFLFLGKQDIKLISRKVPVSLYLSPLLFCTSI